mgnify:CR=1 FL=1
MNKLLSCRYNMDTNRVEARFTDGSAVAIECIAVEDEYGNSPAQRAELDWLLYNKPLEYAQLVLGSEIEHYLETVKAEMNGLTPGLDRSPPPRWMGGQGGQSLKVFGRTRSFWGLSSPKIEMGGKALKWLSRLDYPLAKTGETVNGGAESAVHLDR